MNSPSVALEKAELLGYDAAGDLVNEAGCVWRRVDSWVDPVETDWIIADGVPLLVQWRNAPPRRWWPSRYARDIRLSMLTRAEADRYQSRAVRPRVMVGELWRSSDSGDCLLFIEKDLTCNDAAADDGVSGCDEPR